VRKTLSTASSYKFSSLIATAAATKAVFSATAARKPVKSRGCLMRDRVSRSAVTRVSALRAARLSALRFCGVARRGGVSRHAGACDVLSPAWVPVSGEIQAGPGQA